jgi:hypothetical protein
VSGKAASSIASTSRSVEAAKAVGSGPGTSWRTLSPVTSTKSASRPLRAAASSAASTSALGLSHPKRQPSKKKKEGKKEEKRRKKKEKRKINKRKIERNRKKD